MYTTDIDIYLFIYLFIKHVVMGYCKELFFVLASLEVSISLVTLS